MLFVNKYNTYRSFKIHITVQLAEQSSGAIKPDGDCEKKAKSRAKLGEKRAEEYLSLMEQSASENLKEIALGCLVSYR